MFRVTGSTYFHYFGDKKVKVVNEYCTAVDELFLISVCADLCVVISSNVVVINVLKISQTHVVRVLCPVDDDFIMKME